MYAPFCYIVQVLLKEPGDMSQFVRGHVASTTLPPYLSHLFDHLPLTLPLSLSLPLSLLIFVPQVNGFEVYDPEEAVLLFLEQDQDITLTVARKIKVSSRGPQVHVGTCRYSTCVVRTTKNAIFKITKMAQN
jgi:hypothetical protein